MSPTRTHSPEETERLGEALAPALRTGDVLLLEGPLGAGKTRFVMVSRAGLLARRAFEVPPSAWCTSTTAA
jgi:tRNA threonylcarbamoyladenosine biosynthesis protein TsaE